MSDINTPTVGDSEKNSQIQEVTGEKKNQISETLFGNTESILKDLKENHVKTEDAEIMGYKGKKVHIDLPAVGDFVEGFKFDYFISNSYLSKGYFEANPELEKRSYSMKDVGGLLKAMNGYMKAMGVETDGNMDYENDLKFWKSLKRENTTCIAGDCLKNITGLDYSYWLKDKDVAGGKSSRAAACFKDDYCFFYLDDSLVFDNANLFLRLSD